MRTLTLLALLFAAAFPLSAQEDADGGRVTVLEKRVTKVEKRVTRLEKGAAAPTAKSAKAARSASPVTASFIGKKQVISGDKMGLKLYVELENSSNSGLMAFSGTLVFRDEAGAPLWSKAYACSEPVASGEKLQVTLGISSEKAKPYLKLIKAKGLTVTLEKQEVYWAD
jgi:hypothetical protein